MPTAAHFFAGLVVGLLLYQVSQKRFTAYHVMIFTIESVVGPDLGWLFGELNESVAFFIHSAFGFAVCSFILAIPFRYIGHALKFPIRYSDAYKLTVAAGIIHICIDALGHVYNPFYMTLDPFYLFSYDIVAYFIYTPTGNSILVGAIVIFVLGIGFTYHHFAGEMSGNRKVAIVNTVNAMYIFPVVVGAFLLLRIMPFGDANGFFLVDAIYNTGAWNGVGGPGDAIWIYISPAIMFVGILLAAKKAPRWVLPLGVAFVAEIFLVLTIMPAAGGGEADLGMTYFLLLFLALPALLLGTSFRKEPVKQEERLEVLQIPNLEH